MSFKDAIRASPVQTALMALNITIVVLVCLFSAWVLNQRNLAPIDTLTAKEVQALREAIVFAGENHALLQQAAVLVSRQNAQMEQLVPALREVVDAMSSLATQYVRTRTEVERVLVPSAPSKRLR